MKALPYLIAAAALGVAIDCKYDVARLASQTATLKAELAQQTERTRSGATEKFPIHHEEAKAEK